MDKDRINTIKYLIGDTDVYDSIQTDRTTGKLVVVENNSNHIKLLEDCIKDIYQQIDGRGNDLVVKLKEKIKKLEARITILESKDDNSTLVN